MPLGSQRLGLAFGPARPYQSGRSCSARVMQPRACKRSPPGGRVPRGGAPDSARIFTGTRCPALGSSPLLFAPHV